MALVALIIGAAVTVASTERTDVPLVVGGFFGWLFVPALQLLTGLLVIHGTPLSRLSTLEGYFALHWPWSLWILAAAGLTLVVPAVRAHAAWVGVTAAVAVVWTVRLLVRFCEQTLRLSRRAAYRRVALHQAVTLALILVYVQFAIALWPRLVGVFA